MSEEKKNEVQELNELNENDLDGVSGGAFAEVNPLSMGRNVLRTTEDGRADGPMTSRSNIR